MRTVSHGTSPRGKPWQEPFNSPLDQSARHRDLAAEPGAFDYYLLSLSIAPSFCALSAGNAARDECRSVTRSAFRENRQPHDCDGPPLERLPAALQAELARYMPAGPGLARYEWRKHGTCSGLPP